MKLLVGQTRTVTCTLIFTVQREYSKDANRVCCVRIMASVLMAGVSCGIICKRKGKRKAGTKQRFESFICVPSSRA